MIVIDHRLIQLNVILTIIMLLYSVFKFKNSPVTSKEKNRGFCKYHNFLGHTIFQCVFLRDLVQKTLKEGKLEFREKLETLIQLYSHPL